MQNVAQTIYAQFAQSPSICTIIEGFNQAVDPSELIDLFYDSVFNVQTAKGWGLDVCGRIVGVGRILRVPNGSYIGFNEAADGGQSIGGFGFGVFFGGQPSTQNYALTDDAFRALIMAKAAANISSGSIADINNILMLLFGQYGRIWVQEVSASQMILRYTWQITPVQYSIISQTGILCVPSTVSIGFEFAWTPQPDSDFGSDII